MKDKFIYLITALDCIDRCIEYIEGMDFESFNADLKTQDAVIRNLEILGQVIKDFGVDDFITDFPDVQWKMIAGMRNVLAHEYLGIDLHIVWESLLNDIIPLKKYLSEIKMMK